MKKNFFKTFLCLKTKQNTEMSDEEHSDSEFYYPEEQETAERKASIRGRHFDKVEASGDTGTKKVSFGCIDFRKISNVDLAIVRSIQQGQGLIFYLLKLINNS